nr:glycosyltransferase family 39 protein [Schwartzia sp. (in: firmicutes)]
MEQDKRNLIFLTLLGAALFLFANGQLAITDPVESNYTQTAKEMLLSGDWVSPRIFGNFWYDKPAFFYWELIAAFKVFGFTDFAARFFPAVFGVVGLWLTYFFARRLYDATTALWAGVMLATSVGYWVISKSVITDATLFVFFNAVLVFFYLAYKGKNKNLYYLCYLFAGLAVLTKGPIGILLPGLIVTIFIVVRRDFAEILRMKPLGFAIFFAVVALWYVPMYFLHGSDFINTFLGVHNYLRATVSEHPMWDVWWYYSVLFFLIFFPWGFVTLPPKLYGIIRERRLPSLDVDEQFLLIWALTINVFYQMMATKYTTYTMPSLLPISILAAKYLKTRTTLVRRMFFGEIAFLIIATLLVLVPNITAKNYSGKEVAATLVENVQQGDLVLSYGDYKVSHPYYSNLDIYKVDRKKSIEANRPDGKSWNSKNVWPYWAIEEIPQDRTIYMIVSKKRGGDFPKHFRPEEWTLVQEFDQCRVLKREKKMS